jgi:hypothetical protein
MARVEIASLSLGWITDTHGNAQSETTATILNSAGSAATVYSAATGTGTVAPTSNSSGYIQGFLEAGTYTFTISGTSYTVDVVPGEVGGAFNVRAGGVTADGTTDDSANTAARITAAAAGGQVQYPAGTSRVSDLTPLDGQTHTGNGHGSILKANGSSQVLRLQAKQRVKVRDLCVDGNSKASKGVVIKGTAATASQLNSLDHVRILNATTGIHVTGETAVGSVFSDQADKNSYTNVSVQACDRGLLVDTNNGQEQTLFGCTFDTCNTAGVEIRGGGVSMIGSQIQDTGSAADGVLFSTGGSSHQFSMVDCIIEKPTYGIRDAADKWPLDGVTLMNSVIQGDTRSILFGTRTGSKLTAINCAFDGSIEVPVGCDSAIVELVNPRWISGSFIDNGTNTRYTTGAVMLDDVLNSYRTVYRGGMILGSTAGAATYLMLPQAGTLLNADATSQSAVPVIYLDPADYAVTGRATKYRVRATLLSNANAPTVNFTVGLYPLTGVAGATSLQITPTLGTVTSGSTVAFTAPSASSTNQSNSGDFTAPAAGYYALAVAVSGSPAANSGISIRAELQARTV